LGPYSVYRIEPHPVLLILSLPIVGARLTAPKRNLRVVKWLGQVPAIGVCTLCNRQFKVPLTAMKRVADAQESLRLQFTEHKCKGETASESASSGN
jgi:hypothetical protein